MTHVSKSPSPSSTRRMQLVIVAVAILAIVGEMIVWLMMDRKLILPIDMAVMLASLVVVMISYQWSNERRTIMLKSYDKVPLLYKIYIGLIIYVVLIKFAFFAGYIAHAIKDLLD